ncbi:MAG: hypothetical protein ABFC96_02430 [Thermoguttaceae bacterium]
MAVTGQSKRRRSGSTTSGLVQGSPLRRLIVFFLLLVSFALLPGCGGCMQSREKPKTPEELEQEYLERKKREEEAKKPPVEVVKSLVSRPPIGAWDRPQSGCWYKPGHWTALSLEEVKANRFDVLGELELTPADSAGSPLPLWKSPFRMSTRRDVALSKGQVKSLESILFAPLQQPGSPPPSVAYRLTESRSGRVFFDTPWPLNYMASYQYHFVVLARSCERYGYLDGLAAIRPTGSWESTESRYSRYRSLSFLSGERRPPLPSHANQWTSISCLLWDDALPTALEPAQQQALVDWLHWGGQLILSGPDTLDSLRDSFLSPYLPALADGARKLDAGDLAELSAFPGKSLRPLRPVRPWSGIRLKKHPRARFIPGSGELLVERRIGRGRIVASAFRLSTRELGDWPGCDEMYSAMLLGRPPRKYIEGSDGEPLMTWADGGLRLDAARMTRVRYFVRDTGVTPAEYAGDVNRRESDTEMVDPPRAPGIAAWNDFNPVAGAARGALQDAARVEVPNRSFVLWVIAGYLVVLVPVNWAVFRSLRRVEWAWAAAPVIAVICTVTVIKLAQLDIGFVRSQTEVAVAELQGQYGRAHLTRYNALYTSLSTGYRFASDDPGGVMLPFPTVANPNAFHVALGQEFRDLVYHREASPSLMGFRVGSNSTGLVHSEEMFTLQGGVSLAASADGTCRLTNATGWNLQGVGLLRKADDGTLQAAWAGDVPSRGLGASVPSETRVTWTTLDPADAGKRLWSHERDRSPMSMAHAAAGALSLRKLLELGQDPDSLEPGEVRLVAWSNVETPGLKIEPAAPQARRGMVVIAHLAYGFENDPQPDVNTKNRR